MFEWVTGLLERGGYFVIALLMFLENVFPPIPSEVIMPLAGFNAARGEHNIIAVIVAGSLGSLAGALLWYYIGLWIGTEGLKRFSKRHGRLLTLTPQEIDQADKWFERYGTWAVLFGRLIPTVRTFISVPAGISDMTLRRFLLFTAIGTVIWTAFLALAGWWLQDRYEQVSGWMGPVSNVVVGIIVLAYLYRVVTFRRKVPKEER
ncbi:DedA family protein [Notoacmeibacter ruber]|uniref:DedA family protein n=1 Tax=Notoacmeibacter ruber TaxID=2670375 RepID=A0A3L7J8R5_9HYPH|nr:DedA family protein [Notoacmeibacter ruber]RLQ86920.1 DedA family protein [Notoacmeibacter ruber]